MKETFLFQTTAELDRLMHALERRDNQTAYDLMHRIDTQRAAAAALGKFGRTLDHKGYMEAREWLAMVPSGFRRPDELRTLLLALDGDYVKAAYRAARSNSNARFIPYWSAFDEIAGRHTQRTAEDVHAAVLADGLPPPYPKLAVIKRRYGKLKRGISETLQTLGR